MSYSIANRREAAEEAMKESTLRRWWSAIRRVLTKPVPAEPAATGSWSIGNPCERPVAEAVAFALKSARLLVKLVGGRERLAGRSVLEVGPGQDLGLPLILIGLGASCTVVDRYPVQWDPEFHPRYYCELLVAVQAEMPEVDGGAIETVLRHREHAGDRLRVQRGGLEEIDDVPEGSIDVTYSNAALEHVVDVERAVVALARITRRGGVGFHQTDFRDHRTFDRPLEFLTYEEDEFRAVLEERAWSCGNRVRPSEFLAAFDRAGFIARLEPNLMAEAAYLRDVLSRSIARFRAMDPVDVGVLGGRFILERR
jgi:SAM-dependent methyltransferase